MTDEQIERNAALIARVRAGWPAPPRSEGLYASIGAWAAVNLPYAGVAELKLAVPEGDPPEAVAQSVVIPVADYPPIHFSMSVPELLVAAAEWITAECPDAHRAVLTFAKDVTACGMLVETLATFCVWPPGQGLTIGLIDTAAE